MSHSIPESNALIIRTPRGAVLHTGDWKIDPDPGVPPPTDDRKLRALGSEGCLAVIGDSTNAFRVGRSPSEAEVAKCLAELIRNAPRRVAVTTFASNVARMRAVAQAAASCEREVVIVGRAMNRIAQVARETGYLEGIKEFRSVDAGRGWLIFAMPPAEAGVHPTEGESRAQVHGGRSLLGRFKG